MPEKKMIDLDRIDMERKKKNANIVRKSPEIIGCNKKRHVGAKNPYAVAAAICHGDVPPWSKFPAKDNQKKLANLIGEGRRYEELFDPVFGSCIFCRDVVESIQKKIKKDSLSPQQKERFRIYAGAPQFTTDCTSKYSLLGGGKWFTTPLNPSLGYDDPDFNNPVQGPVYDCYLLSALSSIAWIHDDTTNPYLKINKNAAQPINFYPRFDNPCIGAVQPAPSLTNSINFIKTNLDLPLTSAGAPACAISSEYSSNKEFWPSVYEKMYARYRLWRGDIRTWEANHTTQPPNNDHPDISSLPGGDPFATLTLLTNIPCTIYDMMSNPDCPRDVEQVWTTLKGICYTTPNKPSKKTQYPAVAVTNCTKDPSLPPQLFPYPVCAARAGSGVVYDNELLVASHAYSLLGIHLIGEDMSGNNDRYVILRNPYGTNWGYLGTTNYHLLDTTLDFSVPTNGLTPYDFRWDLFVTNPSTNQKTPNCGVFAMQIRDFVEWFGAFGWIVG